jgi:hypothetical protein
MIFHTTPDSFIHRQAYAEDSSSPRIAQANGLPVQQAEYRLSGAGFEVKGDSC